MEQIKSLNSINLASLKDRLACPNYERKDLDIGIMHIGVGGFHRAHLAYYMQKLHSQQNATEWGICGVGIREQDRKIYNVLKNQDCLYTLITKHPNGKIENEIVGSIVDFLLGADHPESVIEKMAHPKTKIVSLTITEGGYNFNPTTGLFNFENSDIQHDLKHPENPKTIYGYLTAALKKRKNTGLKAFTVLSCDNIEHNGDVAREMLLSFAKKQNAALADWIEQEVCFPNSMVDRITPVTNQSDIEYLQDTFQLKDEWPVTCEPFIQWIAEDKFSDGRPEFEKVGVQFVSDVTPYEKMKLRLLNAGHSVLGILGALHGYETINECIEDDTFSSFMRAFMDQEVSPVLDEVEGIDLEKYKNNLEQRFANPNIKDKVSRICSESSAKLPKFLIPTVDENLAVEGSFRYGTFVLAAWCYYSDRGINKNQEAIEIIDSENDALHRAAQQTAVDSLAFLRQKSIFGDLIMNERFTDLFTENIHLIYNDPDIRKHMQSML